MIAQINSSYPRVAFGITGYASALSYDNLPEIATSRRTRIIIYVIQDYDNNKN